ncbi:MAG TPA: four-carbon acid sugar kinase family protein [Pseudonocardiaceae bacterium]|jgi:4-hydroxythreonine-4-phosphate dehydrogenase
MPTPLWIVADDLTGAADSGVAFAGAGPVRLDLGNGLSTARVRVVDTDTREADVDTAARAIGAALARVQPGDEVFKKIDSLLRGQIAAELRVVRKMFPARKLIVAPAVPTLGRTGMASRLATALGAREIGLDEIRSASLSLAAQPILVCDAETDADLDAIVAAGRQLDPQPIWVGAAGLASALGRTYARPDQAAVPRCARVLIIAGSHSEPGIDQVDAAAKAGVRWVGLAAAELVAMSPARMAELGRELVALARVDSLLVSLTGVVDHDLRPPAAAALGRVCAPAALASECLLLSGGATARAVLTAARTTSLRLLGELEPGVVLTSTDPPTRPGSHVITKSGSFGDRFTLVRLVDTITGAEGAA